MSNLEVLKKIETIGNGGVAALATGKVRGFAGYPAELKNRAGTYLLAENNWVISAMVSVLRDSACQEWFVPLSAGVEYPLHTTLLEGDPLVGLADPQLLEVEVTTELETDSLRYLPRETEAIFDSLVFDAGGNILLVASEIPSWVLEVRGQIAEHYEVAGYKPRPLDNLFHLTIQRVQEKAESVITTEHFRKYVQVVKLMSLLPGGIKIRFDRVYRGSAMSLFVKN